MYEIREYNEMYREQVIELWREICVNEHEFIEWEEELKNLVVDEYNEILVAISEGKVIGTIAYRQIDEKTVELKRVYVRKEHRGSGLAKNLLDEIIDRIKEKQYKNILIETWEKFVAGRRFYEKNNFVLQQIDNQRYNYILEL